MAQSISLLCYPPSGSDAARVVRGCDEHGLFLRDAALIGITTGTHSLRVAVKDEVTNRRMMKIIHLAEEMLIKRAHCVVQETAVRGSGLEEARHSNSASQTP